MHRFNCYFDKIFIRMHPHTKKVILMIAISFGILLFAYAIPVYIIPVALGVSQAANCTDYGCADSTFRKCGGFSSSSSEGDNNNLMNSWTTGMQGMLCMIGINTGASLNAFTGQITLNKV
jgi:hypothetical protein